ncbi:porin family protein [Algoriphagus halophilus]|uniref:porin family protein n=1 Tax=Algoriphagus halophilus TaxID=226505 RepID=UPI00358EC4D5
MKKVLFLILTLGFIGAAQAQFGLRAGLSSANFSNTNYDAKLGFHAGGYYKFDLGIFAVEPGIQYSQRGYEGVESSSGDEINEKLNYIDVPVLVRFDFLPIVNVFAGPQASILASRKYSLGGNTSTSTDVIRGYDVGGVVGVGVNLPLGFNVQASYDFGLTSLNYFDTNVKNRLLKLSLGIDL